MTLVEPIRLGSRTAPSRVVFGPHETNLGRGRALSERHVAYYERRAAGGAGVVVVEEASVHPSDWPYERCPLALDAAAGWAAIASACEAHGTLTIAALGHSGGQGSSAYSQAPLWAPSRVPEVNTREVPKQMEHDDIAAVIDGFAAAARAAVESGCAGVEINAGQHSLVRQFLSGLTNHRGDEWSDRERFAREVLAAVRAAVGADGVVGLRLSGDELAPWAGIVPEAGAALAASLADGVDYVTVVRGAIFSTAATRPDGHVPAGFNLDLAAEVRAAVRAAHGDRVAVIAQGSIVDVEMAERAISDGRCDAVEMTRAQIADADLVAKVRAGHADRVRPCLLCNQTCQVRDARNPIVTCVVDPRSGHETTDAAVDDAGGHPSGGGRPVVVVGAGPAGLEAARVAALRGRAVRVVDAAPATGGMVRTAARGAGRERLAAVADWLDAECRRLGVVIETGVRLDADALAALEGDVIVATGSLAAPFPVAATRAAVVTDAASHLADDPGPEQPVMVWDPVGGPVGVSIAERLAAAGRAVTLATPDNIVGNELSRSGDLAPANARLQQQGVTLERRTILRSVKKGAAVVEGRFDGATRTLKAAVVIDAGHRLPNDGPYREVAATAGPARTVVRAGDAVAPRTILEAIRDGRAAALALDGLVPTSDGAPMGTGGPGGHP